MRRLLLLVLAVAGCASRVAPEPSQPRPPVSVAPPVHVPDAAVVSQELLAQRTLCHAGDLWACVIVGLAYDRGDGTPADLPTAVHYYHLACDHRIAEACALLINLYAAGGQGVTRDPAQVSRLKQLLCEDGHEIHCAPVVEEDPFKGTRVTEDL